MTEYEAEGILELVDKLVRVDEHSLGNYMKFEEAAEWQMKRHRVPLLAVAIVVIVIGGAAGALVLLRLHAPQSQWTRVSSSGHGYSAPTAPPSGYVFKDATGAWVTYAPPSSTPPGFTWSSYTNQEDGLTVEYPASWIRVTTTSSQHSGLALYPPGTDLGANAPGGPSGVGLRWFAEYQPPAANDPTVADLHKITVDGREGTLYTQDSLGPSITVVVPDKGGEIVLTADASSNVLIYVFQHVLESMKFM